MKNIEIRREKAWDLVTGAEDIFLEDLDRAEKKYGEKFMLKFWIKLEDIHNKYNYWRIFPKDAATLKSVNDLENAARDIRRLTNNLEHMMKWKESGYTDDSDLENDRKKKKSIRPKRKLKKVVKKCKCK